MTGSSEGRHPDDGEVPSGGGPFAYVKDLAAPRLDADDHHHLARVRRLRAGDELMVGDGRGRWRRARFADERPEAVSEVMVVPLPAPSIAVAFALVKGAKPELVVQKLTELGVDDIRPFVAARSVVRRDADKVLGAQQRWNKVAREAAQQSRRAWLPVVHPLVGFEEVAAMEGACRADRHGGPPTLDRPLILIGPEGGWESDELARQLPVVGLGPGVLRAETAAIAAGALLAALRSGLVAMPG